MYIPPPPQSAQVTSPAQAPKPPVDVHQPVVVQAPQAAPVNKAPLRQITPVNLGHPEMSQRPATLVPKVTVIPPDAFKVAEDGVTYVNLSVPPECKKEVPGTPGLFYRVHTPACDARAKAPDPRDVANAAIMY